MSAPLMIAQQFFSAFVGPRQNELFQCINATVSNSTTVPAANLGATAFPTDITSLISLFASFSALREWLKIIVFGGILETLRRLAFHFYYKTYNSFFITARFDEEDTSYNWMMVWLSSRPEWKTARDVQISTRTFALNREAVMIEGEEDDPSALMNESRQLAYLPSTTSVNSIWYKGRWVRVSRSMREGYYGRREETLEICILSWDNTILNQLLIEAKKAYFAAQENNISIYVSDSNNGWRHIASRPKRPLKSIVLDPGIKDRLIDDAQDFLASKRWYSSRGIPFRRGYLLYGAPGSGKTSIIHSLAGELGLDVYVISLSRSGLDDTALSELISELPEKCIALMEDIDAAFSQTLNRDAEPEVDSNSPPNGHARRPSTSKISLSGLLNALDGVGAQEGRILFATTNKYDSLDPALCRPGRMDIHIEFRLASKYQAKELYKCFYLPDSEDERVVKPLGAEEKVSKSDGKNSAPLSLKPPTRHVPPKLSAEKIGLLAQEFADTIPEREFSMAALQGFLMGYKIFPFEAVKEAGSWVERERAEMDAKARAKEAKETRVRERSSSPSSPLSVTQDIPSPGIRIEVDDT
ncbi:P-loop containing nucleoside triphosphate hydrolase protein [Panaeolus papilionaceus]|nr:P-loop containing nucleoside triphosphate hydrolase protein [Panaeolus papilionaceus]